MRSDTTLWQLCDSAFPAGAFAHSGGLEAAWQAGGMADVEGLRRWIVMMLAQTASAAIPLVAAAWSEPSSLEELDALSESFLLNHVANRASRAQGQAFLMVCSATFDSEPLRQMATPVRR